MKRSLIDAPSEGVTLSVLIDSCYFPYFSIQLDLGDIIHEPELLF
ncbi:hypothetical protein FHT86_004554 [Rhizobium sp. BK313]|nr:hypothetical protein [Rhizobium sp. BK313]